MNQKLANVLVAGASLVGVTMLAASKLVTKSQAASVLASE